MLLGQFRENPPLSIANEALLSLPLMSYNLGFCLHKTLPSLIEIIEETIISHLLLGYESPLVLVILRVELNLPLLQNPIAVATPE